MSYRKNDIDIQMIEKYLNNELTDSEVEFVELKLASDPKFRKLATDMNMLIDGVRREGAKHSQEELLANLRNSLEPGPTDEEGEKVVIPINRRWMKWAAAAAVTLLAVATFVLNPFETKSNEEIFSQYFVPYENTYYNTVRGDEEIENQLLHDAFFAYSNENYEVAAERFSDLTHDPNYASFSIYHGISYLAINELERAIGIFENTSEENGMYNRARWYLALSYLKLDDSANTEKAKVILNELKDKTARYNKQVEEILDEIK